MPVELWEKVMDANVRGEWLMAKAFGTRLIERGERGKVIMVSSTEGRHGNAAGYTAYSTSKGATDALVRVLATEWGKHGINVNAIAPTVFRSGLTAGSSKTPSAAPRRATATSRGCRSERWASPRTSSGSRSTCSRRRLTSAPARWSTWTGDSPPDDRTVVTASPWSGRAGWGPPSPT